VPFKAGEAEVDESGFGAVRAVSVAAPSDAESNSAKVPVAIGGRAGRPG